MNKIKCMHCGLVNFAEASICRRCQQALFSNPHPPGFDAASNAAANPAHQPSSNLGEYNPDQVATPAASLHAPAMPYEAYDTLPEDLRRGMAKFALALGGSAILILIFTRLIVPKAMARILSLNVFVTSRWLVLLAAAGALLGLTLGIVATAKASKRPAEYGGKRMAITAIALNAAYLLLFAVALIITFLNLSGARRGAGIASNEESAINSMRDIAAAEKEFMSEHGSYATLDELRIDGFTVPESDTKSGYRFEVKLEMYYSGRELKASGFEAVATPVEYNSTGRLSFYVAEDSVIRMADRKGVEADVSDPPPGSALDRYY